MCPHSRACVSCVLFSLLRDDSWDTALDTPVRKNSKVRLGHSFRCKMGSFLNRQMSVLLSAFSSHDPFQFGWQMSDDSQMSVSFLSFGFPSVSFGPLGSTVPLQCWVDCRVVKICTKRNQDLCILQSNILKYSPL